ARAMELLDGCPEDLRHWEWSYVSRQCHLDLHTFRDPALVVNAVAFSPDGRWVASGSGPFNLAPDGSSGDLVVRDVVTGQEAFAPDSMRIIAGYSTTYESDTGYAKLWDVSTGEELIDQLPGYPGGPWSVAFSPDGQQIALTSSGRLDIWDLRSRERLRVLRGH